ncbi:MAG: hypothetical protein LH478_02810 [Chitinophagaceae bacterium]|nr:hypothetical protein [Chitinophagaceae bacterium]
MDTFFTHVFTFVFATALLGCGNRQSIVEKKDTLAIPIVETTATLSNEYDPTQDSTITPLKDKPAKPLELPIQQVGELVLKDSIQYLSNEVTAFMLLDSLLSKNKGSRDFYFRVFNKIMERSGGSLDDAVGDYALTYVENYPKDFLDNSRNFTEDKLASWAGNIGIELFLSSQNQKEAFEKSTRMFKSNCKNCDLQQLARLDSFNNMIWTTIEQNIMQRKPE